MATPESLYSNSVPTQHRRRFRGWTWLFWLVTGSLLLSIGAFWAIRRQDGAIRQADFAQRAQSQVLFLQYALMQQAGMLQEVRALFDASEEVSRDEFRRYCSRRLGSDTTMHSLEWVERVPRADVERFLQNEASGAVAGFMLTEWNGTRMVPATVREEFFPVRFVEPQAGNRSRYGLDMGSHPEVARILARARDSGEASASEALSLPPDLSGARSIVIAVPVYRGGTTPDTVAERRARLQGFVLGSFRLDDFMYSSFARVRDYELFFRIRDSTERGEPQIFVGDPWRRKRSQAEAASPGRLKPYEQTIQVVDRTWTVTCLPMQEGGMGRGLAGTAWVILGFGGLFTILLGVQIIHMSRRTSEVQRLVDERTRDLRMEVDVRRRVEGELRLARDQLELRVGERTLDLARANAALRDEIQTRRAAEDALQEQKDRLGVTLDSIADAVIALNAEGAVALLNRSAERLCGMRSDEVRGRPVEEVLQLMGTDGKPAIGRVIAQVIAERRPIDLPHGTTKGHDAPGSMSLEGAAAPICDRLGRVSGVVLVCRDVTAQLRREAEQATLERLESLGVLAGGIAHDFNNILTAILGNASLLRMDLDGADAESSAMVREIEAAALRAKGLTQQLLTFSKGGAPVRQALSLGALVNESAVFALRGAPSRCEVVVAADLWRAEVDAAQVGQVVHHLVANADQAMSGGGVVRVEVANVQVVPEMGLPLQPGPYVRIAVSDSGVGIPPDVLGRIFDPYFTTKPKGSGLGLSSSYSIVRRHGGHIGVESKVGSGTTFTVYLPALSGAGVASPATPAARSAGEGRGGRILVMDDEEAVRRFVRRMLTAAGYEVTEAVEGEQAVRLYQEALAARRPFHAAILDLTVSGGMGGRDAMSRIRALDPAVRALVSSGYSTDAAMGDYRAWGFSAVVPKPYQAEELLTKLEDVISRS